MDQFDVKTLQLCNAFYSVSALPAPQAKTSQIIGFNEEDKLGNEVKPKAKHVADAPLPPSKQKKK